MNKKKYLLTLMSAILSLGLLFGCSNGDDNEPNTNDPGVDENMPGDNNVETPGNDDVEAPVNDLE